MAFYENPSFSENWFSKRTFDEDNFLGADRMPCPVCGHPTGDCTGDSGPPARIAGFGVTESLKAKQTVLVEEDIYEEFQITPFTKGKKLIHRKGKQIPFAEAERLGLI
jgi:hypothetical protein